MLGHINYLKEKTMGNLVGIEMNQSAYCIHFITLYLRVNIMHIKLNSTVYTKGYLTSIGGITVLPVWVHNNKFLKSSLCVNTLLTF